MDNLQKLGPFLHRLASDIRLKPTHVSMCVALCHAWSRSPFQNDFNVSRRQLMSDAHIRSYVTYHKVIRDLQALGYLDYQPSYHPVKASIVSLKVPANVREDLSPPFDVAARPQTQFAVTFWQHRSTVRRHRDVAQPPLLK